MTVLLVKIAFYTTEWSFCGGLVRGAKELPTFLTSVTLFEEALISLGRKWKRLDMRKLTCVT